MVRLGMVAEQAGVSPSTVSRIIGGTAAVTDDKCAVADCAIAKFGFVPNAVALALAGGRTRSIGVLRQAIDSAFCGAALHGIDNELGRAGSRSGARS